MSKKDFLKRVCVHTAIYFTVTTLLLVLFSVIINADALTRGVPAVPQLLLLPFSLLFAAANVQFKYATYSTPWRVTLHAILTVGGLFCLVYLPNQEPGKAASVHFGFLLGILLIYAVIMGIFLLVRARVLRVKRDATHYRSLYKERDEKHASGKTKDKENKEKDNKKKRRSEKQSADEYESVFKKK